MDVRRLESNVEHIADNLVANDLMERASAGSGARLEAELRAQIEGEDVEEVSGPPGNGGEGPASS